jgi:hypothetical protein
VSAVAMGTGIAGLAMHRAASSPELTHLQRAHMLGFYVALKLSTGSRSCEYRRKGLHLCKTACGHPRRSNECAICAVCSARLPTSCSPQKSRPDQVVEIDRIDDANERP